MPAYNAEHTIANSIKTVTTQDYKNIIIGVAVPVHDSKTLDALRAVDDGRVLVFKQTGKGISDARNLVLKSTDADLYMFLDADDFMKPGAISYYVANRLETSQPGLRFSHYTELRLNSPRTEWTRAAPFIGSIDKAFEKLAMLNFIGTGSVMIDKSVLKKVGYFDTRFNHGEDWHYWMRIAKHFPIIGVDFVTYRYTYGKLARDKPFPRIFFDTGKAILKDVRPKWLIYKLSITCIKGMAALYYLRTMRSRNTLALLFDFRFSDFLALIPAGIIWVLRSRAIV